MFGREDMTFFWLCEAFYTQLTIEYSGIVTSSISHFFSPDLIHMKPQDNLYWIGGIKGYIHIGYMDFILIKIGK